VRAAHVCLHDDVAGGRPETRVGRHRHHDWSRFVIGGSEHVEEQARAIVVFIGDVALYLARGLSDAGP
jgi:hypothetical protein